jgi:hypothetical protein
MTMQKKTGRRGGELMSDAVPVKYPHTDLDWIDLAAARSGISRAEILRRSVRVFIMAVKYNPEWNWVRETAEELPPLSAEEYAEIEQVRAARSRKSGGVAPRGFSLPGLKAPVKMPTGAFDEASKRAKEESDADRRRDLRRPRD